MVFELLQLFQPVFTEEIAELVSILDGVNTGEIFNQEVYTQSILERKLKQVKYGILVENKVLVNNALLLQSIVDKN